MKPFFILMTCICLNNWGKQMVYNNKKSFLIKALFKIFVPIHALDLYRGIVIFDGLMRKEGKEGILPK